MQILKKIKKTNTWKFFLKFFLTPLFEFIWKNIINIHGRILYFLYFFKKKREFFSLDGNDKKIVENPQITKLANKIKENYSNKTFTYFCGKQRLNTIEKTLKKSTINVIFCEVYKTMLIPKKVKGKFDGVMFFSPSAVKSYALINSFKNQKIFSWGNTTANEIKKYTSDFFVSKNPEIKSLIQIIKNH